MKELDVSWNSLSGVGAQALKGALEANESLMYPDVTNASIGLLESKDHREGLEKKQLSRCSTLGIIYTRTPVRSACVLESNSP